MSSNHPPDFEQHQAPDDTQQPVSPHLKAQQQMEEARFAFFPDSLRGRFPQILVLALEQSNFRLIYVSVLILAYITLFATVIGQPHRTELISVLMSFLAPLCFTFWYILFPLNPYQTLLFTRLGLANIDQKDDTARQLVSSLASPQAAAFLWKRSQRLWLYFVLPMAVIVLGLGRLPAIAANASWLARVPLFFFFVFCIFRLEMLRWAVSVIKANE
jgi:hypothetical protein